MKNRMPYDDAAWERSDDTFAQWRRQFQDDDTLQTIGEFVGRHRGGVPQQLYAPTYGSFNACFRLKFLDGGSAIIRFPSPGRSMFAEEKVRNEVAVMRYLAEHTNIPVPFVLHWGMADESPCGLGPFIIMDYVEHKHSLVDVLRKPGYVEEDRPFLDPDISETKLEKLYGQMADVLLQLAKLSFSEIGSLGERDDGSWAVTGRPLTFNMNELVQLANVPPSKLPSSTFPTASSYFSALAEMHIEHLSVQRNDVIDSVADCRQKYIGRHLFRQVAAEKRLGEPELETGPFRLFCDDLRPTNVLLDEELNIVGVIDWEFCYAAPAEFTHSPPWWLLLEMPEYWRGGYPSWKQAYEPRLETFLRVLDERESVGLQTGALTEPSQLAARMRESWDRWDFWLNYAARKGWAFDAVFWTWLDDYLLGNGVGPEFEKRLALLSDEEREALDGFVERKVLDSRTRALDVWDAEGTSEGTVVMPLTTGDDTVGT
ncbi:MAG: hypothetical protein M1817_002813 [Caeruleum heppii]|nr:MAG: hypothetical protein M1817_002813 [Caeruleum heppii]